MLWMDRPRRLELVQPSHERGVADVDQIGQRALLDALRSPADMYQHPAIRIGRAELAQGRVRRLPPAAG